MSQQRKISSFFQAPKRLRASGSDPLLRADVESALESLQESGLLPRRKTRANSSTSPSPSPPPSAPASASAPAPSPPPTTPSPSPRPGPPGPSPPPHPLTRVTAGGSLLAAEGGSSRDGMTAGGPPLAAEGAGRDAGGGGKGGGGQPGAGAGEGGSEGGTHPPKGSWRGMKPVYGDVAAVASMKVPVLVEEEEVGVGESGEAEVVQDDAEAVASASLSREKSIQIALNRGQALARRAQKQCEERLAAAQAHGQPWPPLRELLVEGTWREVLGNELEKDYFANLCTFVRQEAGGRTPIFPPAPNVFRALNTVPLPDVKVVILGQDPYHGPGQAMGLSFSVPAGVRAPSSLANIFKELHQDLGCTIPAHGNLEKWAAQGVLLLNTVLTVRSGVAFSHAKRGWEAFTDATMRAVSQKGRDGIVFLLWGNAALEKARLIDVKRHHVLRSAHPSGLSAHRGFFNCRHFSKTNAILEKSGKLPIDWQL